MRTTRSHWAVILVMAVSVTTLANTGCRSSRMSNLPGMKWMSWNKDDDASDYLTSSSSSTNLPSKATNPSPTSTSPASTAIASANQALGPYGVPQYPITSQSEGTFPAQSASPYYTGPYNTGSGAAGYQHQQAWRGAPAAQQNGFYSTQPPAALGNRNNTYTADARSAAPGSNTYGSPTDSYASGSQYGNHGGSTSPSADPYRGGASSGSGPTNTTNTTGGYSTSSGSRYTIHPASTSGTANSPPGNYNVGGQYAAPAAGPTTFPVHSPPAASGNTYGPYGSVAPAGGVPASGSYETPVSSTTVYGSATNSSVQSGGQPAPPASSAGSAPWRPGSTTDYKPQPVGTSSANNSHTPINASATSDRYTPGHAPVNSTYGAPPTMPPTYNINAPGGYRPY